MSLTVHHSISDLYRALNLPIAQEMDFTVHSLPHLHPTVPFSSPLFRAEYFSFVFVKSGTGQYTTDAQTFPIVPGTIYFTNPGHIKAFEITSLEHAHIITLTEGFLRENVHPDIFEEFPFLLAETVPPKVLPPAAYQQFEVLYMQLYYEFQGQSTYKQQILGNLFVVLLLKIKEQFWPAYNPIEEGDRNSQIVVKFKRLLEAQFKGLPHAQPTSLYQVQDYANTLNLHPNYLSQVIKSKTGKTVAMWITERMVGTAKALLKNTPLSAKEVAYQLGFSEPTHFSRFFKKHTGLTPLGYKKAPA